jgi:hypothetical protein
MRGSLTEKAQALQIARQRDRQGARNDPDSVAMRRLTWLWTQLNSLRQPSLSAKQNYQYGALIRRRLWKTQDC